MKLPSNMRALPKREGNLFLTSITAKSKLTQQMRELARGFTWTKNNCAKTHQCRSSCLILKFLISSRCLQSNLLMDRRDLLATMKFIDQNTGPQLLRIYFPTLGLPLVALSLWVRFAEWVNQTANPCTSLKSKVTMARCFTLCLMFRLGSFRA